MRKKIIFCLLLSGWLSANNHYRILGINIQQREEVAIKKESLSTLKISDIKVKRIKKEDQKNHSIPLLEVFSHTKVEKISKEMTLYGMGVEYQISKNLELSVNLLTELDLKAPSKMLKDPVTNINVALSL